MRRRILTTGVVIVIMMCLTAGCASDGYRPPAGTSDMSGALLGNDMDKRAKEANSRHLSLTEIILMSKRDMAAHAIIDEIKRTDSFYKLTPEMEAYLRRSGVSESVIIHIKKTKALYEERVR